MFFTDTPVAPVAAPAPVAVTQRLRNMLDATGCFTPDELLNELSRVEYELGLALTEPEDDFMVAPLDESGWPVTSNG